MKVGILGGTFNPIHLAHLRIAEEVREQLGLDRVMFIPAAAPPHKRMHGQLPFADRCELVSRAIADNPAFMLSTIEGERPGKSYSVDTLRMLRRQQPGDNFYFIVGSDSFLELGTWHLYREIFDCACIVVVERPGAAIIDMVSALPVEIRSDFKFDAPGGCLLHHSGHTVHYLGECLLDISSTRIRSLAGQGRTIRYLVPPSVERYIREQGLYADER